MEDLRISKLREYLMNIISQLKANYEQLNINFLSNEPDNYSLDRIPVQTKVDGWIIDFVVRRDVYSFRSRMNYSADTISNIENIGFYEKFERIIKAKDDSNDLPDIEGIQAIRCLNAGTMRMANTNTAEFDIQIEIEYRDDGYIPMPSL